MRNWFAPLFFTICTATRDAIIEGPLNEPVPFTIRLRLALPRLTR
jgi:hypothetical protein